MKSLDDEHPPKVFGLSLRVVDEDGVPVVGASVAVGDAAPTTDDDGVLALDGFVEPALFVVPRAFCPSRWCSALRTAQARAVSPAVCPAVSPAVSPAVFRPGAAVALPRRAPFATAASLPPLGLVRSRG
ncbi:MAG: hypothetical protein FJ137_04115 [Deltaproteobacteria bacterium]|nr:hypothetical protein [Deltaproteobacteria bacterium]